MSDFPSEDKASKGRASGLPWTFYADPYFPGVSFQLASRVQPPNIGVLGAVNGPLPSVADLQL